MVNSRIDEKIIKIIEDHQKKSKGTKWTGTVLDYIKLVKEKPILAQTAPERIYNMIISVGTEELLPELREIVGNITTFKFFNQHLFGMEKVIWEIVQFFAAGSARTETGKRLLVLIGPPATGKSTLVTCLKSGLEQYSKQIPLYVLKDCPIHESPLNAVPRSLRPEIEKEIGVRIIGDLCPVCKYNLTHHYKDAEGVVRWQDMLVEQKMISERARIGIGTFLPSDPKNQDITELIGRTNLSKITEYEESDPRALSLDGELEKANRGLMEYIEVFKADPKFHQVLISVTQEGLVKAPNFPLISLDVVVISHSNLSEFKKFIADKSNEALHDRMYVVKVPYVMRYSAEEQIYRKLINQSSLRNIHIAPHTLEIAAKFAILTRIKESKICPDPIKKMKYLNGDEVIEVDGNPPDLRKMQEESRASEEGYSGISSRFVMNAISVCASGSESKCINPINVLVALKRMFKEEHSVGQTDEEKAHAEAVLLIATAELDEILKKEVAKAFVYGFSNQAETLFNNYIENITASVMNKKIKDPITEEEIEPDENLMRSIEQYMAGGVVDSARRKTREQILIYKASLKAGEPFNYKTYAPLREAIEKKLIANLSDVMALFTDDTRKKDPKLAKRVSDAVKEMKHNGYCEHCAHEIIEYTSRILKNK